MPFVADLASLPSAAAASRSTPTAAGGDRDLAATGPPAARDAGHGRGGAPLADHAEGDDLRPDRRDRGRATTSLPEQIGGVRNWDYRYCWLRDASFTLSALLQAGYHEEAAAWREWLLRAVAGSPDQLQIMYGIDGERRLTERELPWLPGYEGAAPVRIGNAAARAVPARRLRRAAGRHAPVRAGPASPSSERLGVCSGAAGLSRVGTGSKPDEGIWEMRGPPAAFHPFQGDGLGRDRPRGQGRRAVRPRTGPSSSWRALRDTIHAEVCREGFDSDLRQLRAVPTARSCSMPACCMIPLVGFLPPRRPARARAPSPRSSATCCATASCSATRPSERHRRPAARRRRLPRLHLLAGRQLRPAGPPRRGAARSSSACSRCATTSACSPRNTTRGPAGRSAISRRPSPTSRWSARRIT